MMVCPFQFNMFPIFQTVSNHPSNESKKKFESENQERTVPIFTQNPQNRNGRQCQSVANWNEQYPLSPRISKLETDTPSVATPSVAKKNDKIFDEKCQSARATPDLWTRNRKDLGELKKNGRTKKQLGSREIPRKT